MTETDKTNEVLPAFTVSSITVQFSHILMLTCQSTFSISNTHLIIK